MKATQLDRERRFEELVVQVHDPLTRYLRRRATADDADDVMSEVLLTVWRRLESVPETAALPWCYGIARRALANHRRGNRRRLQLVTKLQAQPPVSVAEDGAGDHPALSAAMAALPVADRELVTLWAWEGLEPREIAIVLDTTPNAISLRLSRIKKKLARSMERQDSPPSGQKVNERTGSKGSV